MKREPMPEERAAELAMEKTNALWTAYHKEKDPKERERIKLEIDKAHKEIEIAFEARMQAIRKQATDDLTASLRAALKTLGGHARKQYGDAVAEDLLAWGKETNVDALAEWLDKTGWAWLDAHPEHAAKVETAFAAAWTAADLLPFSVFNPDTTNAAIIGLASTAFMVKDGKWKMPSEYSLAYPATPRGSEPPPPKETVRRVVESSGLIKPIEKFEAAAAAAMQDQKTILGLDALRVMFKTRDWIQFPFPPKDKKPATDWMLLLAMPWATERAAALAERLERQEHAVEITIRPKAFTAAGEKWTPLPRAIDMASVLGGPAAVSVDGETYANEPQLAGDAAVKVLRPRALDVVPSEWLGNPAQLTLAINMDAPPECVREYLIETATKTATLADLPKMAPKLLGFMFAAAPMTGRPVKGTLLDLARWMYPEWSTSTGEGPTIKPWKDRRQNKRDLQGLGAAFVAVKNLCLVETKPDGTRHPYDLFTVDYDLSAKPDAALGFMVNPWLVERMKGGHHGGFFLVNMTRWLTIGTENPRLFPMALRLAALWDEARVGGIYNPQRLRPIEADRLAWLCNTLPEGAAMYRAGKTDAGTAKAALSVARANVEADLEDLAEAGMLGDWKPTQRKVYGKGFEFLPLPPPDYAEACKRAVQLVRHGRKT